MRTTRSGSEKGKPRRKRSCIKLKIAVFMPMPSASVSTASNVNPGDLRSWRRANFRSFISFWPQSDNWIDACRGAGWNPGSENCRDEQKRADGQINSRIYPSHVEKQALQCA